MLNGNEFLSELYSRLDDGNPLYNEGQIQINTFLNNEMSNHYLEQYKSLLPKNKSAKILDIGVGEGWFSSICYKLGYEHIELADYGCAAKFSDVKDNLEPIKELHNVETSIKNLLQNEKFHHKYDYIHMSHVIEHIPKYDLIATMDILNKALCKNGKLILRTPNLLGPNPFYSLYCTAGHEYGFVPTNLTQFFEISNFEGIQIHDLQINNKGFSQLLGGILRKIYMLNAKIKYRAFEGTFPETVNPELIMSGYKKD
jgi:2-polyprenyl-3-methyl-5-hydroxy-6-metoxy-1,4-benzoquinol methylase